MHSGLDRALDSLRPLTVMVKIAQGTCGYRSSLPGAGSVTKRVVSTVCMEYSTSFGSFV